MGRSLDSRQVLHVGFLRHFAERSPRSGLRNLRGIAVVLVLGLLLLEGLLRAGRGPSVGVAPAPDFFVSDERLGWVLQPGRATRHRVNGFDVAIEINRDGFRDRDWREPRTESTRVLVVGDSFVFGWGVEAHQSIGARLDEALEDTAVFAAGVPGYGTGQERLLVQKLARELHPDHVVLIYSANDALETMLPRAYGRSKPRFQLETTGADGDLELTLEPCARESFPFLNRSALYRGIRRVLDNRALTPGVPDQADSWQVTRALLLAMQSDLGGVPLTVVSHEEALAQLARETAGMGHLHLDTPLVPLAGAAFLEGDPHWSPEGHQAVAQFIAEELLQP